MPYAPGINFDASPLERGTAAIGTDIADAMRTIQQQSRELDYLAGTVDAASQIGVQGLSPEDVQAFQTGTLSKKREIASKAGMLLKDHYIQAQQELNRQNMMLDYRAAMERLAPGPEFTPSAGEVALPDGTKVPWVSTSRNSIQTVRNDAGAAAQVTPEMQSQANAVGRTWIPAPGGKFKDVPLPSQYEVAADEQTQRAVQAWQNWTGSDSELMTRKRELENARREGQDMTKPTPNLRIPGARTLGEELDFIKRFETFRDTVDRQGSSPLGQWLKGGKPPMRKVTGAMAGAAPNDTPLGPDPLQQDAGGGADAGVLPEPGALAGPSKSDNEMVRMVVPGKGEMLIPRKNVEAAKKFFNATEK